MPSFDYSQFLTQAAADARYQALGSLGSSTPAAETPDHAGTAGVSTSAARQDHVHPIAAAAPTTVDLDGTGAASEGIATSFARSDHLHVAENDAWTTWSPTLTNLTLGNGTLVAKYTRVGRTVSYRFRLTLGSTSAVGTDPQFTLPVAAAAGFAVSADVIGDGTFADTGTSNWRAQVWFDASGRGRVIHYGAAAVAVQTSPTVPFTWTTADVMFVAGTYEAA